MTNRNLIAVLVILSIGAVAGWNFYRHTQSRKPDRPERAAARQKALEAEEQRLEGRRQREADEQQQKRLNREAREGVWDAVASGDGQRVSRYLKRLQPSELQGLGPVEIRPHGAYSLLAIAAYHGYAPVIKTLLEHGVRIDAGGAAGWSPVMLAAGQGHVDAVRVLLENGADFIRHNEAYQRPLDIARQRGHEEVARLLVEAGVDETDGRPLSEAIESMSPWAISSVLRQGASPYGVDRHGRLVLNVIAEKVEGGPLGADPSRRLLLTSRNEILNAPIDWSVTNRNGRTALTEVIRAAADLDNATAFLLAGADPNDADDNGNTPIQVAREEIKDPDLRDAMIELLINFGAKDDAASNERAAQN